MKIPRAHPAHVQVTMTSQARVLGKHCQFVAVPTRSQPTTFSFSSLAKCAVRLDDHAKPSTVSFRHLCCSPPLSVELGKVASHDARAPQTV